MEILGFNSDAQNSRHYNHQRLEARRNILRWMLRYIGIPLFAKVNQVEGVENVPNSGSAILMINHISFVDPFITLSLIPRNIIPLAKVEALHYPIVGIFPRLWQVIPINREEFDRRALQKVFDVLGAGEIVLVAPEGTRSPQLRRAREGIAYIGSRSLAPIIPIAISGTIGFPALRGTAAWRGPGAKLKFGKPFSYRPEYRSAGREQLRIMTDEAMYLLSEMLPPEQRGEYSNLSLRTMDTIQYP